MPGRSDPLRLGQNCNNNPDIMSLVWIHAFQLCRSNIRTDPGLKQPSIKLRYSAVSYTLPEDMYVVVAVAVMIRYIPQMVGNLTL